MPRQPSDTWYCVVCRALNSSWYDRCPVCNQGVNPGWNPRQNAEIHNEWETVRETRFQASGRQKTNKKSASASRSGNRVHEDSDKNSDVSDAPSHDSMWSATPSSISGTSLTSVSYHNHDFMLETYVGLLHEDPDIHQHLSEAVKQDIPYDQLESKLRRFLKQFGVSLRTESETSEQRQLATFFLQKSSSAALAVLQRTDGFQTRGKTIRGEKMHEVTESSEDEIE